MGDIRELGLAVAIILVGFLVAPPLIDRIPYVSEQSTVTKIIVCVGFVIAWFFLVVFTWAFVLWLLGKKDDPRD